MQPLTGIPGTISEEASRIRWIRQPDDPRSGARCYLATLPDGLLAAMVSQDEVAPGKRLWHLSLSHRGPDGKPDRVPSWDELKHAFYRLVQADVPMILVFPRRSTPPEGYADIYPTCLHLWESENKEIDQ